MSLQRVKILRTFVGLPPDAKIGSILEIPKALAVQAKDCHKVEFLPDEPIEVPFPTPEELKAEAKASAKEARAEARAEAKEEAAAEAKADLKEAISHQKKK